MGMDNKKRPQSLAQLLKEITPDIYANLKSAIEIGKWADGSKLSSEQLDSCMQTVILYESKNVAEQERIGLRLAASCGSRPLDSGAASVSGIKDRNN